MKKTIFFIIILLFYSICLHAIKIHISQFNIYPENYEIRINEEDKEFTDLFFKNIYHEDFQSLISFEVLNEKNSNNYIKTSLEATETCELYNIKYLFYGHIKKTSKFYDAEVKLYDNELKDVKKVFYAKVELTDLKMLSSNLAKNCGLYLSDIFGISKKHEENKRVFGGLNIYNGAGYWFSINDWWDRITGLACFETGVNINPITPIARYGIFNFFMRYGFSISYSLGINKPIYVEAFYNTLFFKIPVEFCFQLNRRNLIFVTGGPQLHLDIVYQKLLFADPRALTAVAFSVFANTGYEYWFGKNENIAIGVNNIFNFTFYNPFYIDYKIHIYSSVKIIIKNKKDKIIQTSNT